MNESSQPSSRPDDPAHPTLAPPLDREGALRHARRFRDAIAPLYGDRLRAVYLSGSHARGEGDEDSDIDVAIVLEPPVDRIRERRLVLDEICRASLDAGQILIPLFLTPEDYESGALPIHASVRAEGIPL